MPQSDSREALLQAVDEALRDLENLCGRIERSFMRRNWPDLNDAIADARRATHQLQNAMEEAQAFRDAAFDEAVNRRLRQVHAIRQNQISRLAQYHDAVGERLKLISRWRSAIKSFALRARGAGLKALDQLT